MSQLSSKKIPPLTGNDDNMVRSTRQLRRLKFKQTFYNFRL